MKIKEDLICPVEILSNFLNFYSFSIIMLSLSSYAMVDVLDYLKVAYGFFWRHTMFSLNHVLTYGSDKS